VLGAEEGEFSTLQLDFSPLGNSVAWPQVFEEHLHALPPVSLCSLLSPVSKSPRHGHAGRNLRCSNIMTRSTTANSMRLDNPPSTPTEIAPQGHSRTANTQPSTPPPSPPITCPRKGIDYIQFSGSGTDCDNYCCSGILHPLPPQHGIPGWQRLSMMKFTALQPSISSDGSSSSPSSGSATTSSSSTASSPTSTEVLESEGAITDFFGTSEDDYDIEIDEQTWAYEGIVLPGGAMILGRWWSPLDDEHRRCTGPFIFWNVPDEEQSSS